MATARFGKHINVDEMEDGRMRILASACCFADVGGREIEDGEIQVEIFVSKAEYLAATGQQVLDKLKAEVAVLASAEKAVPVQKRFKDLTIS